MNVLTSMVVLSYFCRSRLSALAFAPSRRVASRFDGSTTSRCFASYLTVGDVCCKPRTIPSLTPSTTPALSHTTTRLFSSPPNTETSIIEVDPYSEQAKQDFVKFYSSLPVQEDTSVIDTDPEKAHKALLRLTEQVLQWNQRLNLVSRKDCTASVVYHRHVLPSVGLLPLIVPLLTQQQRDNAQQLKIVDVGTGGGFPGLPLATLLPNVQFTLVDSIQKKLVAVSEMASDLDVNNVRIHHGRVEEMYAGQEGKREHKGRYDVVLGRSVTALPRFCAWVADLLKKGKGDEEEGRLIYIIGGDLENVVESRIQSDRPIDDLLQRAAGSSDKRALIFTAHDVEEIAEESGEKHNIVRSGVSVKKKNPNQGSRRNQGERPAKGAWSKKTNDGEKKDRGYDDFKRYEF